MARNTREETRGLEGGDGGSGEKEGIPRAKDSG